MTDYMYISIRHVVESTPGQAQLLRVLTEYRGHETMEAMGSYHALKAFGARMREQYPNYATNANHYTCGVETLRTCFPNDGYGWMNADSELSHEHLYTVVGEMYDVTVARVVNCMKLSSSKHHVPYGHLGSHPRNLAQYLSFPGARTWRMERWVELWYLLQSEAMLTRSLTIHQVYSCRQGAHRSRGWSHIEAAVLEACGFDIAMADICKWTQGWTACQREGLHCEWCDPTDLETAEKLSRAAVDEFFMVALFLDAYNA